MAQENAGANKYEDVSVAKLEDSYLTVGWLWNDIFIIKWHKTSWL